MSTPMPVTVADCERVQTNWFAFRARELGGSVWEDDATLWTDGPDGLNLMFPRRISREAVGRALERAHDLGRDVVGAWLSLDVPADVLAEAGFERGWAPWWMTADLPAVPEVVDARVRLEQDSLDYEEHDPQYRAQLALTRREPPDCWYAAARTDDGRFAGRAWSFLDPPRDGGAEALAGVFDMDVWPPFRRQGFGRALLSAVCAETAGAGARHAVLNATPDGRALYRTCGFRLIGEGVTWWHHLGRR
jgi:GNAT superfamily N-acetyltransferase